MISQFSKEHKSNSPDSSPKRRGSISQLFESLSFKTDVSTRSKSRRRSKLLPSPPTEKSSPVSTISFESPNSHTRPTIQLIPGMDVKRICMPDERFVSSATSFKGLQTITPPGWKFVETVDEAGRSERFFHHIKTNKNIAGCCQESLNFVGCCTLCTVEQWTFLGSKYEPSITLLYAQMDGCIPASVKLHNQKFIIPWRYKNRKTQAVSWKIIHMCGEMVTDAECETIVVNSFRDKNLRHILELVKLEAKWYKDSLLVEYLLKVVRLSLGDYGLPGGSTSSKADANLFNQMQKQGHNFMLLCTVNIGLCRHKALLFKILCDAVGIECALVTGYSTGGRHQWNIVSLYNDKEQKVEDYIIDPTSPHFTWTKHGSVRMKAYKIEKSTSFGHGGITMKKNGIL